MKGEACRFLAYASPFPCTRNGGVDGTGKKIALWQEKPKRYYNGEGRWEIMHFA